MICTITFNPALDKTIIVDEITYGEVNRVGHFREDLGGKGINVGRILGGFGADVKHVIVLGEENKKAVLEYFEKDHMALEYVQVPGHTRTNMVIVETDKDITTDINEQGVSVTEHDIEQVMSIIDHMAVDCNYIVMGGSLASGMPMDIYGQIAAKHKDICRIAIDADDDILIEGLKGSPFLIKPNIHELENALDIQLDTEEDIIKAARCIINKYGVVYVLVSMGKEGSLLVSEKEAIRSEAIETEVVSTVGAGDSMLAGFIYGLEMDMSLEACLALGSACSTLTISVEGYPRLDLEKALELSQQAKVYKVK